MSRFKRIKNTSTKKSSVSIDEKIAALNKELGKTGMLSEITNSTDGVYSTSTYVPPQEYIEADVPDSSGILGGGFTQSSAGSGTEGDAPTFSSVSDLFNDTVNATIFPSTEYEGTQGYGIVIGPSFGAGTTYGIIEGGNTYRAILGGHLAGGTRGSAHYKQELENKISAGRPQEEIDDAEEHYQLAVQVEAALVKIGFDNSLFNVTWKAWRRPILFEDLSGSPSYNHPTKGTLYLTGFSMLGTRNRYAEQNARRETTTNPIRRGLEDEPIYPGPIPPGLFPPLSDPAYEELRRRAADAARKAKKKEGDKSEDDKGEEGEDPRIAELLNDAKRQDKMYKDLARDMTFKDPRNYNAAVGVVVVGGYFATKSLYAYLAALVAAGYTYSQLQKAEQDFQPIIWRSQTWSGGDTKDYTVNSDLVYPKGADADEVADMEAAQGLQDLKGKHDAEREQDLKDAKEASDKVNQTGEALSKNPDNSGVARAHQKALDKQQEIMKRNVQKKKARRDEYKKAEEKRELDRNRRNFEKQRKKEGLSDTFKPQGDVLSEGVGLGLYEPEAMNVDLADIRKGVMPEYPKKPPAEMIDGYHQDSKLKPKKFKDKYLLKINEKDLLRDHRLKKGEADEMINTVKMINDYLKDNPADLIYVQQRYPVDDKRLAVLNWKMDQMLQAGEEYMDTNFKENKTLYKRAIDRAKKSIKLTNPE